MHHLPFTRHRSGRTASNTQHAGGPLIAPGVQPPGAPEAVLSAAGPVAVTAPTHHLKYVPVGKKSGLLTKHASHHMYEFDTPHAIAPGHGPVGATYPSTAPPSSAPLEAAADVSVASIHGPPRYPAVALDDVSTTTMEALRSSRAGASVADAAPPVVGTGFTGGAATEESGDGSRWLGDPDAPTLLGGTALQASGDVMDLLDVDESGASMPHAPIVRAAEWRQVHYGDRARDEGEGSLL